MKKRMFTLETFKSAVHKLTELTEKGVYSAQVRTFVLQLVQLGCPTSNIGHIIDTFVRAIACIASIQRSKKKWRIVSARTVGRIVGEANVAGQIQLGYELKKTACQSRKLHTENICTYWHIITLALTMGGDGTTNKNQNFEATSVNLCAKKTYLADNQTTSPGPNDVHKVRFIGVDLAANHRSETQKNATIETIREAVNMFNQSPLAVADGAPFDESTVAMKLVGTHGDHAEDQKAKNRLMGEWKHELTMRGLGAQYLFSKPEQEQKILLSSATALMIARLGGESFWQEMDDKEKIKQNKETLHKLCKSLSREVYLQLSDVERRHLRL